VLAHGFFGCGLDWEPFARGLLSSRPDLRLLAPDLPGHGGAVGLDGEATVPGAAALLFDVARAEDPDGAVLLGYSMGARIVLHAACVGDPGVRAVISIGGTAGIADAEERAARRVEDEERARRIEEDGVPTFARAWSQLPLLKGLERAPEPFRSRLFRRRARARAAGLAASLRLGGTGAMEPLWERLPDLRVPSTFVAGEDDEKFRALAQRMAATVPEGRVVLIPATGHAPHLERPELSATLIAPWIPHGTP
jgi:2-succinyl-6-hydroxy-2,4-cyclohexadiene-1-carboxylate synthase